MDSNSINILIGATDWRFVSSLVEIISSVATCIAMVLASVVAIYGIRSWRGEFKGKRRIELAEEVLALFYQARDAIVSIRNPLTLGDELSAPPEEGETIQEKQARDKVYFIFKRCKDREELFSKLSSIRYRFMAEVGQDKVGPFDEIIDVVNKILIAARMSAYAWAKLLRCHSEKTQEPYLREIEKHREIIYWAPEEDKISERVNKAVADMERTCKEAIMQK